MINIVKSKDEIKVSFSITKPSGRIGTESIIIKLPNQWHSEIYVNPPALCDIRPKDMPEFLEAIKLAAKIASAELEID